jgi:hypothetical protein
MKTRSPRVNYAIAYGLYSASYLTMAVGMVGGVFLGLSAFAATVPTDKNAPLHRMKNLGAFTIAILVVSSVSAPFIKAGRRLSDNADYSLHDAEMQAPSEQYRSLPIDPNES